MKNGPLIKLLCTRIIRPNIYVIFVKDLFCNFYKTFSYGIFNNTLEVICSKDRLHERKILYL